MALAALYKSAEQIGAAYAPSANAAMRELEAVSGVTVRVKAPLGGARTKAQCDALGTSWRISDHWEGRGRALDVDNRGDIIAGIARRQGTTFAVATARYYAIWAKYGWRNITTDGRPFPDEPWHLANHASVPLGTGNNPLPGDSPAQTQKGSDMPTDMIYYATAGTAAVVATGPHAGYRVVPNSMHYAESLGAPLFPLQAPGKDYDDTPVSKMIYQAFAADNAVANAMRWPDACASIAAYIAAYGLTDQPIGNFAGNVAVGDITVTGDPALVAALQENTAVQREVLAAVKALNPPG